MQMPPLSPTASLERPLEPTPSSHGLAPHLPTSRAPTVTLGAPLWGASLVRRYSLLSTSLWLSRRLSLRLIPCRYVL